MTTRVEGRISVKIHGIADAANAANSIAVALDGYDIEVVGLDLVQVTEAEADAVSA